MDLRAFLDLRDTGAIWTISGSAPIASGRGPEGPELWVLSNDPPERTPLLVVDNAPDQAEEGGEAFVAPLDLESQLIPLEQDGVIVCQQLGRSHAVFEAGLNLAGSKPGGDVFNDVPSQFDEANLVIDGRLHDLAILGGLLGDDSPHLGTVNRHVAAKMLGDVSLCQAGVRKSTNDFPVRTALSQRYIHVVEHVASTRTASRRAFERDSLAADFSLDQRRVSGHGHRAYNLLPFDGKGREALDASDHSITQTL